MSLRRTGVAVRGNSKVTCNLNRSYANRSNHSSILSQSELSNKYKRKIKGLLTTNRYLARKVEAARARLLELEAAEARQNKIFSLCLPQIKTWLEDGISNFHALYKNHSRAIQLITNIVTPGNDVSILVDPEEDKEEKRRSLHPPGSQWAAEQLNVSTIEEEDAAELAEEFDVALRRISSLQASSSMEGHPMVTLRRSRRCRLSTPVSRHTSDTHVDAELQTAPVESGSGAQRRRSSVTTHAPAPEDPVFSTPPVDEQASEIVQQIIGEPKTLVTASTLEVPRADKANGQDIHEYSVAFSSRPKIPRTPGHNSSASAFRLSPSERCATTESDTRSSAVPWDDMPLPAKKIERRRSKKGRKQRSQLPGPSVPNQSARASSGNQSKSPRALNHQPSTEDVIASSGVVPDFPRPVDQLGDAGPCEMDIEELSSTSITPLADRAFVAFEDSSETSMRTSTACAFEVQPIPVLAKKEWRRSSAEDCHNVGPRISKPSRVTFVVTKPASSKEEEEENIPPQDKAQRDIQEQDRLSPEPSSKLLKRRTLPKARRGCSAPCKGFPQEQTTQASESEEARCLSDDDNRPSQRSGRAPRTARVSYKEPTIKSKLRRPAP